VVVLTTRVQTIMSNNKIKFIISSFLKVKENGRIRQISFLPVLPVQLLQNDFSKYLYDLALGLRPEHFLNGHAATEPPTYQVKRPMLPLTYLFLHSSF
jgi:hypothetical protein